MSYSVEEFLNFLKLDEYLPNFINNNIHNLHIVDESLLMSIGVEKIGHRKRILSELGNLYGVGNYSPQDDHGNINSDEIPPPLPPKSKKIHNLSGTVTSRPVKPPRKPNRLQKTTPIPSSQPEQDQVAISTLPQSPIQSTIPTSPKSPILATIPISPRSPNCSIIPTLPQLPMQLTILPQLSYQQIILTSPHSPTSSIHPTIPTLPQPSIQPTILTYQSPIETDPQAEIEHAVQKSSQPPIPPREDLQQSVVDKTRISKNERASKTKSVELISFNEKENEYNISPRDIKTLPTKSTKLKKRNTIGSTDKNKDLEIALTSARTAMLNREVSNRNISPFFEVDSSFDSDGENIGMRCRVGNNTVHKTSEMVEHIRLTSEGCCDGLLEDDHTKDVEELCGIPISMKKDKDELISIVRNQGEKPASQHRKSRFFQNKTGYLNMPGGVKGIKRWIEFTGTEIKCYKEKNGILKLIIPVLKMTDVIWQKDAKKPTFHIKTEAKTYTFSEPIGNHNVLTIWANIILEGVMAKGDRVDDSGVMANPDIEGYLLKEGHNILHDIKERYVVIKENKLCYYNSKEEFDDGTDFISCLEMALVSLKIEDDKRRLILNTHTNKSYVFQAADMALFNSWKEAIETSIQYGIGDDTIRNQVQENLSNMKCADCGENNPIYASINLLVVACSKCIEFHREMGVHISKARSLLMDKYVWTPSLIKLLQIVGNDTANSLWAHKLPADDRIQPDSTREEREHFIYNKYKEKKYFDWSPLYGEPENLGLEIRRVVVTDNVVETLKLLISGADIYYVGEGSADLRTPYELAKEAGKELQVELLSQFNGHLTKEERKKLEQQKCAMQPTKTGVLQIKTTRSDTLKERQCTLNGKKIEVKKMDKMDECEIIDLTKLEEMEIDKEDLVTLILKLPERTYFLKSYIPEDAESWYRAIRSKQVIGVAIENQDCNDKKIPYVVAECISFMEQHALMTEGIYRRNGSLVEIKKLTLLFNQDASNLRLQIDEFPDVHTVACLIKLYLRELPDPLLTKSLYEEWIRNAEDTITEEERLNKLYQYKSLLQELPPCNYLMLRFLILHLNQVISLSESNKMGLRNIIVIFGPLLVSCGVTVDQAWLDREYSILTDILSYYQWLFDVTEVELKVLKGMIDFHHNSQQQQQKPTIASFTMVTIFVGENEDQMKMTHTTKPSEVCLFCIKKHKLSVNTNWGLFEITMEECLERLVHSSESVLKLAENMGVKRKLVVKCNYVTDLISECESTNLCISGSLHFNKGDKWKRNCYVEVKTGNIRVYKAKGNTKEEENLSIHETELFIGNNQKKKPLTKYGFAVFKIKEGEFRYFGAEDEMELNKFIATILQIRYPSGVWTPINETMTDEVVISEKQKMDPKRTWFRGKFS